MKKLLSIGIDVAKSKLDVCLLFKDNQSQNLQLKNNQKSFLSLVKTLKKFCQEKVEEKSVVIESTGGYHYGITFYLKEKGFKKVCVINPLLTKKHALGKIRKTKTDKIDSQILAKIGLWEDLHIYTESQEEIIFKKKSRLLHFLGKQLHQVSNRILSTKNLAILDDFEQKILKQMQQELKSKIKKVKQEIVKNAEVNFDKIPGLSDATLKAIIAELGNISRFKNRRQIVAFAGMDPSVKESGTSVKGRSRLSKRGSATLRLLLHQGAWGVMLHNEKYQEYYQKKKSEGKHYYTCLSAMARKLLLEIFGKLKEHSYSINHSNY